MAKKNNNVGISFSADVVDLKTGLKQVKDEITKADKEFAKNTASMDKWANNTEGLGAKLTQLNTKLDSQKKAVQLYQDEIDRVSKLEGNHSAELEKLKDKLQSAEIAVKKTEKEISHYSSSLEDVTKQEKEQNSELGKLTKTISEQESELASLQKEYKDAVLTYGKNSKEAKSLAKQITDLSGELDDNRDQVNKAEKALDELEKGFDDAGDAADDFSKGIDGIKNIGGTVAKGIGAIGAGIAGLATAFLATGEGTREFRNNMAKLETSFTEAGLTAEDATETYKNLYSVLGDEGQATEATTFLAKIADNEKELASATHTLTGIYATFGASLPLEGLTEAINHTSSLGSVQGNLADALEWSGVNVDDFNAQLAECTSEEERQALIMETLSGIYDGAADTYKEVNADIIAQNEAQASLSETMAAFGEKAEPILTAVKDGFNLVMQEVLALTENVDFEALAAKIKDGFSYFIDTIIPAIKDGFTWIMDNKDTLIAGIAAIGAGMLAWNVVSIIQGVTTATGGFTGAVKALNAAMKANLIGIIVTALIALTTYIITLWNTNEDFRNAVIKIWDKVKEAISNVIETVKTKFNEFKEKASEVVESVKKKFNDFKEVISKVIENVKTKFNEFKAKFDEIKTKAKEVLDKVVEWFTSIPEKLGELKDKMLDIGDNLIAGLWEGITNAKDWILGKIKGFTSDVLDGIKGFFGIHSPSKKMAEIGKFLDEGLAQGIEKNKKKVTKATDKLGQDVLSSISGIEKELEKKNIANKIVALGGKVENPFATWTWSQLDSEAKKLEEHLDSINKKIIENGVTQEEWGTSQDKINERAKLLEERLIAQNKLIEVINARLPKTVNQDVKSNYETKLNDTQKAIEVTMSEFGELEDKVTSIPEKMSFTDKLFTNIGEAFGHSGDKLTEFVGSAKDKMKELGSSLKDIFSQGFDAWNESINKQIEALDKELEKFNAVKDAEIEKNKSAQDEQLAILESALASGNITEKTFQLKKQQLEKDTANKTKQLEEEKRKQEELTLKKKNELAKKQFNAQKANDIASAISAGAVAIMAGFKMGPIAGAINAVVQAGITAAQVGMIAKQKFVPMLAKGGVVDSPTLAMVGEAGKEVVMPLENNTGWIRELAEKLNEVMQKDFSLGMNVTQLQPAFAGASNVNNYFYQTINSPQQLSRKEIYRDTKNLLSLRG